MPTNEIREKNVTKKNCQPLLIENIERLSRSILDRKIPSTSTTSFINGHKYSLTKNNFNAFLNNFNAFLKEYDNDSLIFNISLTNKDAYISSLNKRFADGEKEVLLVSNKKFYTYNIDYCEYYKNIIKSIPDNILWVNELTSRELRCFQKRCFGEIIFGPSINLIKDNNIRSIKNIDYYVLHVPGFLYTAFENDKCHRNALVLVDLLYNLFNENKI